MANQPRQDTLGAAPYQWVPQQNKGGASAPSESDNDLLAEIRDLLLPLQNIVLKVFPLGADGPIPIDLSQDPRTRLFSLQNTGTKAISVWYFNVASGSSSSVPTDVETLNPSEYRSYPAHVGAIMVARTAGDTTASITYTVWI